MGNKIYYAGPNPKLNPIEASGLTQSGLRRLVRGVFNIFFPGRVKDLYRETRKRKAIDNLLRPHDTGVGACDLIYERDSFCSFYAQHWRETYGLPWIIECNGIYWDEWAKDGHQPALRSLYKREHINKWKQADRLIVVSEFFKRILILEGIEAKKINVLHNGVDMERYRSVTTGSVKQLRESLGMEKKLIVGFVGHIHSWHRIDMLLESILSLSKKRDDVVGLVVGGGDWIDYKNRADGMGLGEKVVFTGPMAPDSIPLFVMAMDLVTIPGSNEYGSPVKLFEYGAAKKPVIAAEHQAIQEVLTHGSTGWLIPRHSASKLAEAIEYLADRPDLCRSLAENFHTLIQHEHSWEHIANATLEIIKDVVRSHDIERAENFRRSG